MPDIEKKRLTKLYFCVGYPTIDHSQASVANQQRSKFKLSNSASPGKLNVVENLGLTNAQKKDQAQIIAALKQHVEGRINETIE